MKILIEESVLRQALDALGNCEGMLPEYHQWLSDAQYEIRTALDAAKKVEDQLATVTKERDELVEVVSKAVKLNSFREFNDHIPAMKAALAKLGAGKGEGS